jgi:hypothetical protein
MMSKTGYVYSTGRSIGDPEQRPTPLEVIREVERDTDNDGIYCVGGPLAARIVEALENAGYSIVANTIPVYKATED